jgi:hypothetical protein
MEDSAFEQAQSIKTVFEKVIQQSIVSRNDGKVALCCYVFFSRHNASQASSHINVISIRQFCKQYQIKTEQDLRKHCAAKDVKFQLKVNSTDCRSRADPVYEKIKRLTEENEMLRAELEEKNRIISSFPVVSVKQENEEW